jgi:energy-coupling factor transport system permease protein
MPFAEFTPRDIYLQKIDPRAFLTGFFLLLAAFIFAPTVFGLLAGLVIVFIGIALAQVQIKIYLKGFLFALPFVLILAVVNLFFNTLHDVEPILVHWKFIVISLGDVILAIKLVLRFMVTILFISLVSSNLSTSRFIHGLEALLSPLKKLGIPVLDFIVSIEIAIRFIPILTISAERIAKAQASRGALWGQGRGSLMARIRQVLPVLVPLFVQSLHKAESLALAMDSRGFGVIPEHTSYTCSEFKYTDAVYIAVCLILSAAVLFIPFPI